MVPRRGSDCWTSETTASRAELRGLQRWQQQFLHRLKMGLGDYWAILRDFRMRWKLHETRTFFCLVILSPRLAAKAAQITGRSLVEADFGKFPKHFRGWARCDCSHRSEISTFDINCMSLHWHTHMEPTLPPSSWIMVRYDYKFLSRWCSLWWYSYELVSII